MKLPVGFDPLAIARGAGAKRCSWSKLGDGPWSGSVWRPSNDSDVADLVVEELASSWKVTDVSAGTSSQGADLGKLLKKVIS